MKTVSQVVAVAISPAPMATSRSPCGGGSTGMGASALGEDGLLHLEATAAAWGALSSQTVRRLCGLTSEPWSVAAMLYRHGVLPQSRLTSLCRLHKVAVSRSVDVLVHKKQWVTRLACPWDGRVWELALTEKGVAEAAIVVETLADIRRICTHGIGEAEMGGMRDLLQRMEDAVERVNLAEHLGRPRLQVVQAL